jgi:tetratricopeptide (TPR) repeat protein
MTPDRTNIFSPRRFLTLPVPLPFLLLIAAVLIAYINSINNQFVFDDTLLITINDYLNDWGSLGKLLTGSTIAGAHIVGGFYRPLQMLLYFLIYQATGPVPFGFHLLNIALHAANACLLFALGRRLNFNAAATFLAALIWALHPIHTEAVTYISGTADPLAAFFCLAGLLALFPDFAPRRFWHAAPFMILGLLAKESTVAFPLLAMCCLYFTSAKRFDAKTYLSTWPLWVIAFVYVYWRSTVPGLDGPQSFDRLYRMPEYSKLAEYAVHPLMRLYTFLATLPAYLGLLLWPHDLHMERDFEILSNPLSGMVAAGTALCIASLVTIIRGGQRLRPLGFGLLWFAAAHFPDTGLLIPMNAIFLEHWMYLPTAGLFLGLAQTLYLALGNLRKPAAAGVLALALILAALTTMQNTLWRDPVTFYTYLFKFGVGSARTHNNLASAYMADRNYDAAIAELRRALDLGDTYAEIHYNLAQALLRLPDQQAHMQEAIDEFTRAAEIDPDFYRAYDMLAQIYAFYGNKEKSGFYKQKADAARKNQIP